MARVRIQPKTKTKTSKSKTTKNNSGMTAQEVALQKRMILVPQYEGEGGNNSDPRVLAFQAELMHLGFVLSEEASQAVSTLKDVEIGNLADRVLPKLSKMVGNNVKYKPMYPNFPRQVMEMDMVDLYLNAIIHYWSGGQWSPQYEETPRELAFEATKFKTIDLATDDRFNAIFTSILGSNASINDADKKVLTFFMDTYSEESLKEILPGEIPFKEQLCAFVADCISRDMRILGAQSLKTATDILRVVTHLNGGDISLASNTKFKSMNRRNRRMFINQLERVVNEDDIARHLNKWIKLSHSLHIGEYAKSAPKAFDILNKARNGHRFRSFDANVEAQLSQGNYTVAAKILSQRPGNFARRLDHMLRSVPKTKASAIVNRFLDVADKVDTRVLLQLFGHFKVRVDDVSKRLVFPKGQVNKGQVLNNTLSGLGARTVTKLMNGVQDTLENRFSKNDSLGKVYIDPSLEGCPIPLSLRSASEGLEVVGRGTQIPLSEKDTLRLFIYWVGQDIDLTAVGFDENLNHVSDIGYYNLTGDLGCHSGDITHAPNGAAEFIDISFEKALKNKYRYVAMTVNVYSGSNFNEHSTCYAGWMTRDKPNKNAIFDPKTVEQKIDIQAPGRFAIPVIFDMKERKAIWLDMLASDNSMHRQYNNAAQSRATLKDLLEAAVNIDNKPTLYDLFVMHANACGKITENRDEADTVFAWDGDVKPTDINTILSDFLN